MKTKIFRAGQCYRENRMLPVLTKALRNSPTLNTKDIARSTIKGEDMYCLLVQPNGNNAIFIDVKGTEYLVSKAELNQTFGYRNSFFVKKEIPLYTVRRGISDRFDDVVDSSLERPDIQRKYKGWISPYGILGQEPEPDEEEPEVDEASGKYVPGGLYVSDDGEWSFIVTAVRGGNIEIIDLSDEKTYNVEVGDLELANARKIDFVSEFAGGVDDDE